MSSALELQKTRIDFIIAERSLRPQKYWISILQYLEGLLSQAELFEIVKECLGLENIGEHNKLITTLLFRRYQSQQEDEDALSDDHGNASFIASKATWSIPLILSSCSIPTNPCFNIDISQNYLLEALEPSYSLSLLDPLYPEKMLHAPVTHGRTSTGYLPSLVDIFDYFTEVAPLHGLDPSLISDQVLADVKGAIESFSSKCILKAIQIIGHSPCNENQRLPSGYSINKVKELKRSNSICKIPSSETKKKSTSLLSRSVCISGNVISIACTSIMRENPNV